MFTGIIQDIGTVTAIVKNGDWRLTIRTERLSLASTSIGASIACSGACLTVIAKTADTFDVQVSHETLDVTTLKNWDVGTRINLEPALRMGDELGGHLVSGHVDGIAQVIARRVEGDSLRLQFELLQQQTQLITAQERPLLEKAPPPAMHITIKTGTLTINDPNEIMPLPHEQLQQIARFFAPKGSIVIDGVSLTVNEVDKIRFGVNIIPHTQIATTLGALTEGDTVNFEVDLIARYLDRLIRR